MCSHDQMLSNQHAHDIIIEHGLVSYKPEKGYRQSSRLVKHKNPWLQNIYYFLANINSKTHKHQCLHHQHVT